MIAAAPHYEVAFGENRELEYLLLGDLRQTLEEPVGPLTSLWLLAILDLILVSHPRTRASVYLPVHVEGDTHRARSFESRRYAAARLPRRSKTSPRFDAP